MTNTPKPPRPSPARTLYSLMFWLLVYLVGMGVGSTIAWLAGADVNLQMISGLATGFVFVIIANRWVRGQRSRIAK